MCRAAFGIEDSVQDTEAEGDEREHVEECAPDRLLRRRRQSRIGVNGANREQRHSPRAPGQRGRGREIQKHNRHDDAAHRTEHTRV